MIRKTITAIAMIAGLGVGLVASAQDAQTLDELLQEVREGAQRQAAENQERERRFLASRNQQRAMLQQAEAQMNAEERRGANLKQRFDQNEKDLAELEETLRIRVGAFGELFGVVRQFSGDTKGMIDASLVSSEFPDRGAVAGTLAQIKGLPSISDLRELWALLLEEMTESGRVTRFNRPIVLPGGESEEAEVIRLGAYMLSSGDRFLSFDELTGAVKALPRQPAGRYRSLAAGLSAAGPGETVGMAIDPTRGQLLGQLINTPNMTERVKQGGPVGAVIIVLGLIGLLIGLSRLLYLMGSGRKIRGQLKREAPSEGNALGRILGVYDENKTADTETLELKLDEAILKETPKLERWQGAIKLIAAVAPLLGLLGTVIGMILTFQAITLFGTGDPKLMAGGISTALMTTVMGLCVAIPLLLLHSFVASMSRGLIEILEEQSAGMIARQSEAAEVV